MEKESRGLSTCFHPHSWCPSWGRVESQLQSYIVPWPCSLPLSLCTLSWDQGPCMAKAWICSDLHPNLLIALYTRMYQGTEEELLPSSSSVSIPTINTQKTFAGWCILRSAGWGDKGDGKLQEQRRSLQPHSVSEATRVPPPCLLFPRLHHFVPMLRTVHHVSLACTGSWEKVRP